MGAVKSAIDKLACRAAEYGFDASSTATVGALLRALAAAKPGGRILELGTGVGLGTAHLLGGMDQSARLVTVELDGALSAIAQEEIRDPRIDWVMTDGGAWLEAQDPSAGWYDLVFADTWPGKFTHLDEALALVAPGGLYVVDDLLPAANWPAEHRARVEELIARLEAEPGWATARLDSASGVMLCTRVRER